jgi:hypothetical protein
MRALMTIRSLVPAFVLLSLAACASAPPPPPAPPPVEPPVQSTTEMQVAPPGDYEMNVSTKEDAQKPDTSPQGSKYSPNLATPSQKGTLLHK